jgi:Zn-dependent protease with chaperone function
VRAAGGDPARCDALDNFVTDNTPFYQRWWPRVWRIALAWSLAVLVLLGLGVVLSAATLRQTANVNRATTGRARGRERLLRQIYGGVIALSCALYYVSLPLMLVTVVGLGGGIIYACFALGHIPIKLVLIVLVATVVTVWSVVKSLFIRRTDVDPGVRLALATEPGLRELLDEVAAKVGTRAVDNVYVTPGTDLAVMERGGMLKSMRGQTERCLILGIGLLDGLKVGELKSLLAHEYGHFSNEDTAGGRLSLHVRQSIITMAHSLARGGAAGNYNPAWLFVTNYYKIFLRISQGSSRLQEVLADRWAAVSYGSRAFVSGFRHVMRRSAQFEHHVGLTVNEVVKLQRPLANLYSYEPEGVVHEEIEQKLEAALAAAASPYDSHPAPSARLAWVSALAIEIASSPRDEVDAWMVFRDRAELESRMTVEVRENVWRNHSVMIVAPEPA